MKQVILCITALVLALCLLASCGAEVTPESSESSTEATSAPESSAEEVSAPVSEAESSAAEDSSGAETDGNTIVFSELATGTVVAELPIDRESGAFFDAEQYANEFGLYEIALNGRFLADADGNVFYVCGDSGKTMVRSADGSEVASFCADDTLFRPIDEVAVYGGKYLILYRGGLLAEYDPATRNTTVNKAISDNAFWTLFLSPTSWYLFSDEEIYVRLDGHFYDLSGERRFFEDQSDRVANSRQVNEKGIRVRIDENHKFESNSGRLDWQWTIETDGGKAEKHSFLMYFDGQKGFEGADGKSYAFVTCYPEGEPEKEVVALDAAAFVGADGAFYLVLAEETGARVIRVEGNSKESSVLLTHQKMIDRLSEREDIPMGFPELLRVPDVIPDRGDGSSLELVATYDRDLFGFDGDAILWNGEIAYFRKNDAIYDAKTRKKVVEPKKLHEGAFSSLLQDGTLWFLYSDGAVCSYEIGTGKTNSYVGVSENLPAVDGYIPGQCWGTRFLLESGESEPRIVRYEVDEFFGKDEPFTLNGEKIETVEWFIPHDEAAILGKKILRLPVQQGTVYYTDRMTRGQFVTCSPNYAFIGSMELEEGFLTCCQASVTDENGTFLGYFYFEVLDYYAGEGENRTGLFSAGGKTFSRDEDVVVLTVGGKAFVNSTRNLYVQFDNQGIPYLLLVNEGAWELYRLHLTDEPTNVMARMNQVYGTN